jgi:hypothetical protein
MKQKFIQSGFVLLLVGLCASLATAQEHKMDHGAMDHSIPGGEYRSEPLDHVDHGDSLFRTRGSHDQAEQSKPKDMDVCVLSWGRR